MGIINMYVNNSCVRLLSKTVIININHKSHKNVFISTREWRGRTVFYHTGQAELYEKTGMDS